MFFRREKPKVFSFDDYLSQLRSAGFQVAAKGSGKAVAMRGPFAAVVEEGPAIGSAGKVVGNEIGELVHGGYQVRFETKHGKVEAAQAEHLKAYHAFLEDLREALGLKSLYNESLGTVNGKHFYDRVKNRDAGH
jgi:hypothetical protein